MKRIERGSLTVGILVWAIVMVGWAFAASGSNLQKIVVFAPGTSSQAQQQAVERSGSQVLKVLAIINGMAIQLPSRGTAEALSTLQADPNVKGVYNDPTIAAQGMAPINTEGIIIYIEPEPTPRDEVYGWGLDRIGIRDVREEDDHLDGSGVNVAILDTGIDQNHPDLKQIIFRCISVRTNSDSCQDDNGHGTHIAGIIAAQVNNTGLIGAAPNIRIHAIKVLDENGAGQASDLMSGLEWVLANNVKLVNMSLGFPQEWGWECPPESLPESAACPYPYPYLARAIETLEEAGVIMVAAAGNRNPRRVRSGQGAGGDGAGGDGADCIPKAQGAGGDGNSSCYLTTQVKVPAAYPWVLAVGATDKRDRVTDYSRSGPEMAEHGVVAPGGSRERNSTGALKEGILSTTTQAGYGLGIGTSQATAHVTGVLALLLQLQPELTSKQVLTALKNTARSEGLPREWEGAGVIDAERLVDEIKRSRDARR